MHMIFVDKALLTNFWKTFDVSGGPRELSRDLFSWFSRFLEHISGSFQCFYIFFVAKSYQIFAASLVIIALVTLGKRLKVLILLIFKLCLAFFELLVLAKACELGQ